MPKHLLPALIVNINAPDDIVRAGFEVALAGARQQFPAAFTKPGLAAIGHGRPTEMSASDALDVAPHAVEWSH